MDQPVPTLDALLPRDMARRAEDTGVAKAALPVLQMASLAGLAGVFISFGAVFATTVSAGTGLSFGMARLTSGVAFSLGLILVSVGGAELFTGNSLIVMAWASGRVRTRAVLRNWSVVYVGNFVAAVAIAWVVQQSGQYRGGSGEVGRRALDIAAGKLALRFWPAFLLGICANVLVCLAVWLCLGARSVIDKVACIVFPITAFVAAGFEHSVANMYFVPHALFIKANAPPQFWTQIGTAASDYPKLTWRRFLTANLLPVTIGNMVGGSVLVGLVYWSIYLRTPTSTT
jgi:formate transporter